MSIKNLKVGYNNHLISTADRLRAVLKGQLPETSLNYCVALWERQAFDFKITNRRITKLGDYRFYSRSNRHLITVNGDLNPYAFLITYIHEYAHLEAQVKYGSKKLPHGMQWKQTFQQLMQPLLSPQIFPTTILAPLKKHMQNPKASSSTDQALYVALRSYDRQQDNTMVFLYTLHVGHKFKINKRSFVVVQPKRTRVLCKDLSNKKNYLIAKMAEVEQLHVGNAVGDQSINQFKKLFGV